MNYDQTPTDIYPTRYAAFDHPGTWAVFTPAADGTYRSCREDGPRLPRDTLGAGLSYPGEMAVLYIPQTNADWPDLTDGTFVEVGGSRGTFTAICHHTYPTRDRRQKSKRIPAPTLNAAIKRAEAWITRL